jgi:hypothetical protein
LFFPHGNAGIRRRRLINEEDPRAVGNGGICAGRPDPLRIDIAQSAVSDY